MEQVLLGVLAILVIIIHAWLGRSAYAGVGRGAEGAMVHAT